MITPNPATHCPHCHSARIVAGLIGSESQYFALRRDDCRGWQRFLGTGLMVVSSACEVCLDCGSLWHGPNSLNTEKLEKYIVRAGSEALRTRLGLL